MSTHSDASLKDQVRDHWQADTCGTRYGAGDDRRAWFRSITENRYRLEPYIPEFAGFANSRGLRVLEIGVGAGSDFSNWVRNGADATGVDLTDAAIALTRERLTLESVPFDRYRLQQADAENLAFPADRFDLVYSWGVLHHTPDTPRAFAEAYRVLKTGGTLRAMIYHLPSWTTLMLWGKNCALKGRPWRSPRKAVFHDLESPGTKAYTKPEAARMLRAIGYENIALDTRLGPGDLLAMKPSAKYQDKLSKLIWAVYPRWLVRLLGHRFGLFLMIEATKPAAAAEESAARRAA